MDTKEKNHADAGVRFRARASTQTILGTESRQRPVHRKWVRQHEELKALRDEILAKRESLAQDANAAAENPLFGEHMADAATDSYDRDFALSMLCSEQNALYEIEAALDRLAHGTYGMCELTGEPIEPDRLRAIPWTRFSADAQKELEAKGALSRTQFGELRNLFDTEDLAEPAEEEPEAVRTGAEEKRR